MDLVTEVQGLIAGGESQTVEFKREFPKQASRLAGEIAAFATSNDGVLLIGVDDDGAVVGIPEAASVEGRGIFVSRIEGICRELVQPVVSPAIQFCEIDGRTVAIVRVSKGTSPVYHAQDVPHLRQVTSSRAARPHEVVELVLAWQREQEPQERTAEELFLDGVADLIVSVLAATEDAMTDHRLSDPWFSSMRSLLDLNADAARHLVASAPPAHEALATRLADMADVLETGAHEQVGLNFGLAEVAEAVGRAREIASAIKTEWIDPLLEQTPAAPLAEQARVIARKLQGEAARSESGWRRRGPDPLRAAASEAGRRLLRLTAFGHGLGGREHREAIRRVALRLREIETREVFGDGGASMSALVADLKTASAGLVELTSGLEGGNDAL